MALLVCPRFPIRAVPHYVLRLSEYLDTFSPQFRDVLKSGFINSLEINRSIVVCEYVAKPNNFTTIR
jgi:hypothetical protein